MDLVYHPLVQDDLTDVLEWYSERSDTAANRFFEDFENTVEAVRIGRRKGISIGKYSKKIFLRKFPYSLTYEFFEDTLYVFVLKHQKRSPKFGMRRRRPTR